MNYRVRRYVAHASLAVSLLMPLASSDCSAPTGTGSGSSHGKHQCYFGTKYHKKGHYHKTSAGKVWVPKGCH